MREIKAEYIAQLDSKLAHAQSIVIVTHAKPDGDAMGSCVGMFHALKLYGKRGTIVLANPAPDNLSFLTDGIENQTIIYERNSIGAAEAISSGDLIICLDFNAFHRTDTLSEILKEAKGEKVLIDHHLNPDQEAFSLIFSKTDISSASELLYSILMMLPCVNGDASNLPIQASTALMTGMTTDTNNFANSVYPSTLSMASTLLAAGVDRDMIIRKIYNEFRESRIRLMGHVLKDLMKITSDGVAYIILDQKTMYSYNVIEGDTEGFVNIPLSIDKVKMSILIKEDKGMARVSIRSRKEISANRCAREHFNGGGHENAAGGRLYFPTDIAGMEQAGEYIEAHTHTFMTENYETIK